MLDGESRRGVPSARPNRGARPPEGRVGFAVVEFGEETALHDLSFGRTFEIGSRPTDDVSLPGLGSDRVSITWRGEDFEVRVRGTAWVNGRGVSGMAELNLGEELSLGALRVVVGLTSPMSVPGRRVLTHDELRERLYEEMARAGRVGRPTALAMVQFPRSESGDLGDILNALRAGDLIGSYAPDIVEILLPDTEGFAAEAVLGRVLRAVPDGSGVGLAIGPQHGESPERILEATRAALVGASPDEVAYPPGRARASRGDLVAEDPKTRALLESLKTTSSRTHSLVLLGEANAGKGVIARWLHRSRDRSGDYVRVRCGGGKSDESWRVFFSEGEADRAIDGTLFLDDIGSLPPQAQQRLLAWLDGKDDVLIVSATHRSLDAMAQRGAFSLPLYDRLRGAEFVIPSLRERPGDLLTLAQRFAAEFSEEAISFTPGAVARLRAHPWPGNVLELRNVIARAVTLALGSRAGGDASICAEHLPAAPLSALPTPGQLRERVDEVERETILKALADANQNQTHAAKRLGISRRALIYKMEKYGLKPPPKAAKAGATKD